MKKTIKMKKNNTLCVYCGKTAKNEDHIPSRNLYKGVAKNFRPIKVPSCIACNNSLSKNEEFFRDLIVASRYNYSITATQLFDSVVSRSIRRNPGLALRMFKQMFPANLKTLGGIYLGKRTGIKMTKETHKRVFNVLDKYIRGLFWYQFKEIVPNDWIIKHFWVTLKLEKKILSSLKNFKWNVLNRDIFYYGCDWVPNTYQSIWCLVFFGKPFFYSFVLDPQTANRNKIK